MLFGYSLVNDTQKGLRLELALIPDKSGVAPVPIYTLPYTEAALCFASQEEAFLVKPADEASLIVEAVKPAKLYLTPNRPEKPGFSVSRVKIGRLKDGKLTCHFDREKGWEPFTPNSKEY